MKWLHEMLALTQRGESVVIVTVIETSGSAPREIGARIAVSKNSSVDSIGGGNLEHEAIQKARDMLNQPGESIRRDEFVGLGITMSQCCGGAVRLLFEKFSGNVATRLRSELEHRGDRQMHILVSPVASQAATMVLNTKHDWRELPEFLSSVAESMIKTAEPSSRLVSDGEEEWFLTRLEEKPSKIVLFGAGHVGKALVKLLQDLPFLVEWVDERADLFPQEVPDNVVVRNLEDPLEALDNPQSGAFYVVMTHSHGLDYELCLKILQRREFGWLGLIGSGTKRKRFEKRFIEDGVDSFTLQRLHCPIGLDSIKGKLPAVIAISTAAQLLEAHQAAFEAMSLDSDNKPRSLETFVTS